MDAMMRYAQRKVNKGEMESTSRGLKTDLPEIIRYLPTILCTRCLVFLLLATGIHQLFNDTRMYAQTQKHECTHRKKLSIKQTDKLNIFCFMQDSALLLLWSTLHYKYTFSILSVWFSFDITFQVDRITFSCMYIAITPKIVVRWIVYYVLCMVELIANM